MMIAGRPAPLGAHFDGEGVNFAIFSDHATAVTLCLFTEDGTRERHRLPMTERDEGIWFGYVAGLRPGQQYGYRIDGPYAPEQGHRFNVNKLLIDPYARQLTGHPVWHDAVMGYEVGHGGADLSFDVRDSAPHVARSLVSAPDKPYSDLSGFRPPDVRDRIIYEAHVKGLTQTMPGIDGPGAFRAIASDPVLDHLNGLGVTTLELLPVHAFINDRFLVNKGLTNYWGYQSIGFFAPDPRYLASGDIAEFRHMVTRLHEAGIEVILDVVYNHSGESDELGPTLSFRGIDNASYYRLRDGGRYYINDTGTGNTLNMEHPRVRQMVLDSLRYWVEIMGVDGFRFDLCATLGRTATGFDPEGAFFAELLADPLLAKAVLIGEPWDIGPGGYQLGNLPAPFMEWNDSFRDSLRRYWRGDEGQVPGLAHAITGSASQFDHDGRGPNASVNFLTAHDGYTLRDVVSFNERHNLANGEDNRDGHGENFSDNMGVEGPTDDPGILAARAARCRAMMASLLLSQGTPMILAGDEIGNSQDGNNNAYCQDSPIGWLDWARADGNMLEFTRQLISLRKELSALRQDTFLHGEMTPHGRPNLIWLRADGAEMTDADWTHSGLGFLALVVQPPENDSAARAVFIALNAGAEPLDIALPPLGEGATWLRRLDTSQGSFAIAPAKGHISVKGQSVVLCATADPVQSEEDHEHPHRPDSTD